MSYSFSVVSCDEWVNEIYRRNPNFHKSCEVYRKFIHGLSILRIFWADEIHREYFITARTDREHVGFARLVKFKDRYGLGSFRFDLQDIMLYCYQNMCKSVLKELINFSNKLVDSNSTLTISVSNHRIGDVLIEIGYKPYRRSVVIEWDTNSVIPKSGNDDVEVFVNPDKFRKYARMVMSKSWGYYIAPNLKFQDVIIAFLNSEPVGSAYLNKLTGNIDFGVHVVKSLWRRRIGARLLHECLKLCKSYGFKFMTVVRVINLYKVGEADRRALSFYVNCGGKVRCEVIGYKKGIAKRRVTNIKEFII